METLFGLMVYTAIAALFIGAGAISASKGRYLAGIASLTFPADVAASTALSQHQDHIRRLLHTRHARAGCSLQGVLPRLRRGDARVWDYRKPWSDIQASLKIFPR